MLGGHRRGELLARRGPAGRNTQIRAPCPNPRPQPEHPLAPCRSPQPRPAWAAPLGLPGVGFFPQPPQERRVSCSPPRGRGPQRAAGPEEEDAGVS